MKILLTSENFRSTISAAMISKQNFHPHGNASKNNNNNLLEYLRENNFHNIFSFENSLPCQYYDEDIFIKLNRNGKRFCNIFSLNIRSLPRNGGELLYFFADTEHLF